MTARPPCILVVDDEPQIHRFLKPALEAAGYRVERAETAAEGVRLAASRAPDAVLLDLGLPDADGHDALARIRAFSQTPVIVLSARNRESEKIAALDGGADDYVEKPFGVGELLARLRTALRHRRAEGHAPEVVRLPGLDIDLERRSVRLEGDAAPLGLSPREWDLLSMLARNLGRVLTHAQLLSAVWGPAHVEDVQYLRVYVGQLRHKLAAAGRLIKTEAGVGYRLLDPEAGREPGGAHE
jgi:two-component system KDP operon response regulator KdpE